MSSNNDESQPEDGHMLNEQPSTPAVGNDSTMSDTTSSAVHSVVEALQHFLVQALAHIKLSASILKFLWRFLGPVLVTLSLFLFIVWGASTWLDSNCDKTAVKTTSRAFSWIVQVDICEVIVENRVTLDQPSSGLSVLKRGSQVGDTVSDLVDTSRDLVLYEKVADQILNDIGIMALDFRVLNMLEQGELIRARTESAYAIMDAFIMKTADFDFEMRDVVSRSVRDFSILSKRLGDPLPKDQSGVTRWLDETLSKSRFGRWYYQYSPDTALMTMLTKMTSMLVPEPQGMFEACDSLAADLRRASAVLTEVMRLLEGEEQEHYDECNRLKEELLARSRSKFTWLKLEAWNPFQASAACDDELPKSCCMPMHEYLKVVKEQTARVTGYLDFMSKVRRRLKNLQGALQNLRNAAASSHGRPDFAPEDMDEARRVVAALLSKLEAVDAKWKAMVSNPELSAGTVGTIGEE